MTTRARSVHFASLGIWTGALIIAGASAAIIFPTMKDIAPTFAKYNAYTGEHWKLGAGMVQNRVFLVTDAVCAVAAVLAATSLAIEWMASAWKGLLPRLRIVMMVLACATLGYQLFILGPVMSQNIRQHWVLAAAGDNESAEKYRVAFEADHPKASGVMYAQFGAVLLTLGLGLIARAGVRPEGK